MPYNNQSNNDWQRRKFNIKRKKYNNKEPRKKRVKPVLNIKNGEVETYMLKFPRKVTEYLKARRYTQKNPLLLGNLNIGEDDAYLTFSDGVSNEMKQVRGVKLVKKYRGQPERVFWINKEKAKLQGYVKYQYRGQYTNESLVHATTVKQADVPDKLKMKQTDRAAVMQLNSTTDTNVAIPEEILSSLGKRNGVDVVSTEAHKMRRTEGGYKTKEELKVTMIEFFEEKKEKGEEGWNKKKLFSLMDGSEERLTAILNSVAKYDKTKRLWVLKEGSVQ